MRVLITIDDGSQYDLRIAQMLKERELKGIFFIPKNCGIDQAALGYIEEHHEVGNHTLSHGFLTKISLSKAEEEIKEGIKADKLAYPKGWFNDEIKDIARKYCKEAFTMKLGVTDITGYDPMELPRTFHMYPRADYRKDGIVESAKNLFERAKTGGYFNLCMHGWEVEKFGLWDELKQILNYLHENKNSFTQ